MVKICSMMRMNFIVCTISLGILMCIPSTKGTSDDDCRETFKIIDQNRDGLITKEEVESFMGSRKSKIIVKDKTKFHENLLTAIERVSFKTEESEKIGMTEDEFVSFMKDIEKPEPDGRLAAVNKRFGGKQKIPNSEVAYAYSMDPIAFDQLYYTPQELADMGLL
uniref:EF-hand domain-containing protein n=1 Tax=Nilaparvata lugens TaxID=108931 RepID=A0A220XII4_NILLU|nr:hypothetical protein [Nilaparvata lugens]